MGFVVDEPRGHDWIGRGSSNAEVLFPYLNGEDLNSRAGLLRLRGSSTSTSDDEVDAATYVRAVQRGSRAQVEAGAGRRVNRKLYASDWWQFARASARRLRRAIAGLTKCW